MLMYPLLQCHDLLNFYCFYVHAFSFVTTFRLLFIPCISYLVLSKYISIRTYIFFSGELFCKCKKIKESVICPYQTSCACWLQFPCKTLCTVLHFLKMLQKCVGEAFAQMSSSKHLSSYYVCVSPETFKGWLPRMTNLYLFNISWCIG